MNTISVVRIVALLALPALAGCAGVAMEGANVTKDQVVYDRNLPAARAGDPKAQYKVGEAQCCSLGDRQGLYDTRASVEWLCRSSAQGYAPASQKLAQIYSGDVVDGVRVLRRLAEGVSGRPEDRGLSYAWLRVAETQGAADAKSDATELWSDLDDAERNRARQLLAKGQPLPCRWEEVFTR